MKQPVIKPIKGPGHRYELVEDYTWQHNTIPIVIPRSFRFDGATIPSWLWSILGLTPAHPRILAGSVIHDYIYCQFGHVYPAVGWLYVPKKEADKIFDEMNKQAGMDRVRRFLVYNAVKWFGRY